MTPPAPEPCPDFSSPVASALRRFLEFKRAAGYRYHGEMEELARLDWVVASVHQAPHTRPTERVVSRRPA